MVRAVALRTAGPWCTARPSVQGAIRPRPCRSDSGRFALSTLRSVPAMTRSGLCSTTNVVKLTTVVVIFLACPSSSYPPAASGAKPWHCSWQRPAKSCTRARSRGASMPTPTLSSARSSRCSMRVSSRADVSATYGFGQRATLSSQHRCARSFVAQRASLKLSVVRSRRCAVSNSRFSLVRTPQERTSSGATSTSSLSVRRTGRSLAT